MNHKKSRLNCVFFTVLVVVLTGCLYPHTTLRSPDIYGRILDARTHAPVEGAKVFLTDHPKTSCSTDSAGDFRLKETHNFHLLIGPGEGSGWPPGQDWSCAITVSHPKYETYVQRGPEDWRLNDKGDILLQPKQ